MATIQCTIDGQKYSVEVSPPRGDLNQLYRRGDAIVDELRSTGFEVTGDPPAFQDLSTAHQQSSNPDIIDLGDWSNRVTENGGRVSGSGSCSDNRENSSPPSDGSDGSRPSNDEEVTLMLVGPDGQQVTRHYDTDQGMGAVTADLQDHYEIDRDRQVTIYASEERRHDLPTEAPVSEYDGRILYWGTEPLL
jgi:hypothetical protein